MSELPSRWNGKTPKWALSKYDGAEKDFSEWLYGVVFWEMWNGQEDSISDAEASARAEAIARAKVLERTFDLSEVVERAKAWQLYHAHHTGWYRLLPSEPSTVREFLQSRLDDVEEGSSQHVDLSFAMETLLPALEALGVNGEKLIAIPTRWSKTRVAIPSLRRALETQTDGELEDTVNTILEGIADDQIPVRDFRESLRTRTYRQTLEPLQGEVYILPEGDLLVLRVQDGAHRRAVEMALKGVVSEWSVRDSFQLVREVGTLVLKREAVHEQA